MEGFFADRAVGSVTVSDIEKARRELARIKSKSNNDQEPKDGRAIATVNCYLSILKRSFNLAIRNGKAKTNPVTPGSVSRRRTTRESYT